MNVDPELLTLFRDEATDALSRFDVLVDRMANAFDAETLNQAFRIMHNVKGSARLAGADEIEKLAHELEELLDRCRHDRVMPSVETRARLREHTRHLFHLLGANAGHEGTVRIEGRRLDRLLAFAGELMLTHARIDSQHRALDEWTTSVEQRWRGMPTELKQQNAALVSASKRNLERLGYLVDDWSAAVKRARMLPLGGVVSQWHQIVAEAALASQREVTFEAHVGELEINRQMVAELREPLMHLLRNAVAHGIEPATEREAKGKPVVGRVSIHAHGDNSILVLDVSDDGRGIDGARVKESVVRQGLLATEQAAALGDEAIAEWVFHPGLSTAGEIDALSGRGVGLDACRRGIESLDGTVRVEHSSGEGTTFRITLPTTVVSMRGFLLRAGKNAYVVATQQIARAFRAQKSSVQNIDGGQVVKHEGHEPLRLRWLSRLMGQSRETSPDELTIVAINPGNEEREGLVVDAIDKEIVFISKALPAMLPKSKAVSGATILGDGSVAPVLDVRGLMEMTPNNTPEAPTVAPIAGRKRILVVDDSLTIRTLESSILSRAGYEVETAQDGAQAWQMLEARPGDFALVVSDVQMPELDGFELTRRVRQAASLKQLPIILVTNLEAPEHVAKGAAAGANEYIVKGKFDQTRLLEAVARHV